MDVFLSHFRKQIDEFMRSHPQSPLDADQRAGFAGLVYYDEDPALSFVAAPVRLPEDEPVIEMETSTGDSRPFRRWGVIAFEVGGKPAKLTIYSDAAGVEFFLPFRDATSGGETYGAGRYLDNHRPGLALLDDGQIELNFNYAYNPYCAYSPYFSCPLPPRENWLAVPIRAGEKDFQPPPA